MDITSVQLLGKIRFENIDFTIEEFFINNLQRQKLRFLDGSRNFSLSYAIVKLERALSHDMHHNPIASRRHIENLRINNDVKKV